MDTLQNLGLESKKASNPHILQELIDVVSNQTKDEIKVINKKLLTELVKSYDKNAQRYNELLIELFHYNNKKGLCKLLTNEISFIIAVALKATDKKQAAKYLSKNVSHFENLIWGLKQLAELKELKSIPPLQQKYQDWIVTTYGEDEWKKLQALANVDKELVKHVSSKPSEEDLKSFEKTLNIGDSQPTKPPKQRKENSLQQTALKAIFNNEAADTFYLNQLLKISCPTGAGINMSSLDKYNATMTKLLANPTEKFTDPDFPPEDSSLSKTKCERVEGLAWKRIPDIWPEATEFHLFGDIKPNEIDQGKLGDCYFISGVSVLAEKPHLIKRLFHTSDYNPQGIYSIWLCDSGEWRNVIIDDYIPVKPNSGKPAFSGGSPDSLWVMLLEKAFAKTFGTFNAIQGGAETEALILLTGAPGQFVPYKDVDSLWTQIKSDADKGFCLTCGSKNHDKETAAGTDISDIAGSETIDSMGVVSRHAYSILGVYQYGDERLVKMRNPWGKHEWTGDWSDKSERWTEDAKTKLQHNPDLNDGIFFIGIKDFDAHFHDVAVCKVHEPYHYKFLKFSHPPQCPSTNSVIQVKVHEKGHVYITLTQSDARHHKRKTDNYKYSPVSIFVAKTDESYKIVDVLEGINVVRNANHSFELFLDPGTYIVFFELAWCQPKYRDLVLSAYSEHEVDLLDISDPDVSHHDNILKDILTVLSKKPHKYVSVHDFSKKGFPGSELIQFYSGYLHGYSFLYYVNDSATVSMVHKLSFESDGYTMVGPFPQAKEYVSVLHPKHDEFLLFKKQNGIDGKFNHKVIQESFQEHLSDQEVIARALAKEKVAVEKYNFHVGAARYQGGEALYYTNKGEKIMTVTVTFTAHQNVQLNHPINESKVVVDVPPGQSKLIRMDVVDIIQDKKIEYSTAFTHN
jgi:calpain-15